MRFSIPKSASSATEAPRRSPVLLIAALWLAIMAVAGLAAPWLAPYGYADQDLMARLRPPALVGGDAAHWLGTDHLGRDVLSRVIYAIRVSMAVALVGALIGAVFGTFLGFLAAHARGVVEESIMALVDVQAALPFLIFALLVIAFFGNDLVLFVLLVGLHGWERYARLARGLVLDAKTKGYAEAARAMGLAPWRIYLVHVGPNVASAMIVQFTLNLPETILLEAGLSFLGLGIQPPLTSLGLMLNDSRNYIVLHWWLPTVPGAAIFLTTLSVSLLGDALRDRLDRALR